MDVAIPEVDGRRTGNHLVAPVRAMLPLVLRRASPQAAEVVEAASAAGQPSAVDSEEAKVAVGLV